MKELKGTGVALATPMHSDGRIDFTGLDNLVNYVIDGGVNYLVVLGTTGESATLNADEKNAVLEAVKESNNGRLPIVLGIGGNNTTEVEKQLKSLDTSGLTAILSVSPYYNKPTQEGIYRHYKRLAECSPLPIILYNVPGRTGSNISSATTLKLANEFDNIVAVKEASGDMEQIMEIIRDKPSHFEVISGDDALTLPILAVGGYGVISVVGQAFPNTFSEMVSYGLSRKMKKANEKHYQLLHATQLLFAEGNPGGLKSALKIRGICKEHVRLPLYKVSKSLENKIAVEIDRIGE